MGRGYAVVEGGKLLRIFRACQGRVDRDEDPQSRGFPRYLSLGPLIGPVSADGVYRVSLTFMVRGYLVLTAKRVEPATEAKRLVKLVNKPKQHARTGSPGIQGFQHSENMSHAAQDARWYETEQFLALMQELS